MSRLLSAERVGYAYERGEPVFDAVDVQVQTGYLTGLVGPNGSGKSTLLRLLCGLLKPSQGHIRIDNAPLASLSRRERARTLAFLPQEVTPAFSLDVFEVVCLGRYPHSGMMGGLAHHDFEVAERCMADTEVMPLKKRPFTSLSGGERQRVLLAGILAQEPDLMLLDEPTSALDIHHQIEIFALLKRLAHTGYGVVVVTHDLNLAAQFCDNVVLLEDHAGVLATGAPAEVFTEENLSRAYDAVIRVGTNPLTGAPLICAEAPKEMT